MAAPFENSYVVLSNERASHINARHVKKHPIGVSKFKRSFNLTSNLARLTRRTFFDRKDYRIIEQGYKHCHGRYSMYVFKLPEVIGFDPSGAPSKEVLVYYSWKPKFGKRFHIITAYPFSRRHYKSLKWRKTRGRVTKSKGRPSVSKTNQRSSI